MLKSCTTTLLLSLALASPASTRGIGDIKSGAMGYRLGCSIHELANTGFHCPEFQQLHGLIDRQTVPPYWPTDNGFENPFVPNDFNGVGGGGPNSSVLSPHFMEENVTD